MRNMRRYGDGGEMNLGRDVVRFLIALSVIGVSVVAAFCEVWNICH
jgi:hypothetical protein